MSRGVILKQHAFIIRTSLCSHAIEFTIWRLDNSSQGCAAISPVKVNQLGVCVSGQIVFKKYAMLKNSPG